MKRPAGPRAHGPRAPAGRGEPPDRRLSPKAHWDGTFARVTLPRVISTAQYNYYRFDQLFKSLLPANGCPRRLLEVGCGASAWLVYFAKELGYQVEGIDYSEFGCRLADRNLRLNGVSGRILCGDILDLDPDSIGLFDVVFSYGVIEHFRDPAAVLRIMHRLTASGGLVVAVVPNMKGVYGRLQRMANESIYRMHHVIDQAGMTRCLEESGFDRVFVGYFGTLYLPVVNWSAPPSAGPLRRRAGRIVARVDALVSWILRRTALRAESELLSPYVVGIGRKR